jgi:hypothetical protein
MKQRQLSDQKHNPISKNKNRSSLHKSLHRSNWNHVGLEQNRKRFEDISYVLIQHGGHGTTNFWLAEIFKTDIYLISLAYFKF